MQLDLNTGALLQTDGFKSGPLRTDRTGGLVTTDAHARYYEAITRGNCYQLSANNYAATAFIGAAGGTPAIAIYNPVGSGKILSILTLGFANRAAATVAGTASLAFWGGPSAIPTGTPTVPTNMLTLQTGGSIAKGFVNTALTGSTAVGLILPISCYYWATAAAAMTPPQLFDIAGLLVCAPGNLIAFGLDNALTTANYYTSMIWEELPI